MHDDYCGGRRLAHDGECEVWNCVGCGGGRGEIREAERGGAGAGWGVAGGGWVGFG